MPIVQLKALLAYAAVEGHARAQKSKSWRRWRRWSRIRSLGKKEDLVQQAEYGEANDEANEGDEDPVLGHPEDDLDVGSVPAVAQVVGEETPGMVVVLVGEEDAHAIVVEGLRIVVVAPDDAEEERAGRGHDGDVWEWPAAVVVGQRVDGLEEEGVAGNGAHGIVGDASGQGSTDPGWVGEERVKAAVASIVEINVYAAKVVEHKVSNGIGALDGVWVAVEGLEEPGVSGAG
ncbi:hypothetical protein J1614_005168 [Plenodomus biglobosus]|nr:hypothetical protein J1614_005168 [Plenodomus biglobosus]